MAPTSLALPDTETISRIDSSSPTVSRLSDVWKHGYLLWIFTWRDIKVRYKQTFLGASWAALQPLFTMLVFTFVFSRVAKVSSGRDPYPVFVLSGLLPWQFFAYGLIRSSNSLVENRYLLTRVPVPRLALPVSATLTGAPDFVVSLGLLFVMMGFYRIWPSASALLVVPLTMVVALTALSMGLFLAAVNVRYRDVGYIIPFFTQLMFFLTPVAYPLSLVPQPWRLLYSLNPMSAVVEVFRYVLLRNTVLEWKALTLAGAMVCTLLAMSFSYFRRTERTFADVV